MGRVALLFGKEIHSVGDDPLQVVYDRTGGVGISDFVTVHLDRLK